MRKILTLSVVGVLLLFLSLPQVAQEKGPPNLEVFQLRGLQKPVQAIVDVFGIPHIYAKNAHDLYMVMGFIHARDRLFQMDVTRRTASGTLAELLGPPALKSDVMLRTMGLRRAAELSLAAFPPEAVAELQAYADGVNAYIAKATKEGKLPPEYKGLELTKIEPWTPVDSLVIGKAIVFQLSFDLDAANAPFMIECPPVLGKLVCLTLFLQDMFRSAPADPAASIPDAKDPASLPDVAGVGINEEDLQEYLSFIGEEGLKLAADYYEQVKDLDFFKPIINRTQGSNWFIVSGQNTVNGYPLFANDPHLQLSSPSVFYEVHQVIPGELNVYGVTFPGIPLVILGQTERIIWGATSNPMDVTDTFQEKIVVQDGKLFSFFRGQLEPLQMIPEAFKMNNIGDGVADTIVPVPPEAGVPQATLIIPRHGPVIMLDAKAGVALSVQYTGFYATRELMTFRIWNRAKNLEEFKEGLKYFDAGSQNWAYADVEGNIAYFTSAELPLREDLDAGVVHGGVYPIFPRDGTGTYLHQWIPQAERPADQAIPFRILPFEEMPQIVNPEKGFVVNANNDPIGNTLDNNPLNQKRKDGRGIFYLDYTYDMGFRAGRITELIKGALANKISLEDMKRFQGDVVQLLGRRFVPYILNAVAAAQASGAPKELASFAKDRNLLKAAQYLESWSFNTPTGIPEGFDYNDTAEVLLPPSPDEVRDSIATTIFNVWIGQFVKNTIDATLTELNIKATIPPTQFAIKALLQLLDNFEKNKGFGKTGLNFFLTDCPTFDFAVCRDFLILKSLQKALSLLKGDAFAPAFNRSSMLEDYRWGKLHRVTFEHILDGPFNIPAPPKPGFSTDGGIGVVDASEHDVRAAAADAFAFDGGPSRRIVAEVRPEGIKSYQVIPGGESGVLGARHFGDQLRMWLANEYHPVLITDHEVKGNAETYMDFWP